MVMYRQTTAAEGNTSSETFVDVGVGYITDKGWVLGAIYAIQNEGFDDSSYGSTSLGSSAFGPSAGWISQRDSGAFVIGHFFLPKSVDTLGTMKTWGYQGDVGYKILMRRLALAIQMSYKHFSTTSDTLSTSTSDIIPTIGLLITF